MDEIEFGALQASISRRKREMGWDDEVMNERMRNRGSGRTPEKRHMLRRIRDRCEAAGLTQLDACL